MNAIIRIPLLIVNTISKINFFERVESGAEMLSFVLENLKDKDLRWKKIDFDKVHADDCWHVTLLLLYKTKIYLFLSDLVP